MTDAVMSGEPWFIDLHGSMNAEDEKIKRNNFYKKIIAIGQAIQSGLQNASKPHPALPSALPAPNRTNLRSATVSSLVDPLTSSAAKSAFQGARKEISATKQDVRRRRLQIESTLYSSFARQSIWKHKKHLEDVQSTDRELDIDDILSRAHMLIPPVSGLFAHKQSSSESFDENDYYSSQADSSISSPRRIERVTATMLAVETRSEGELSEEEFEPELHPAPLNNLLPAFQDAADAAYEPALVSDEGDDEYEPPIAESPPYEPVQTGRSVQQLVKAFAGQPLAPRAIAINHIQSPVAPQPSHISPVTTATFAQQLDHSAAEQSSRSDHENVPGRGKKGKSKNKNANGNKQKGVSKKRKRHEESDSRPANKRRSQGDGMPFIKQEPVTPPPVGLATPKGNEPAESSATTFSIPAGFKLVPIHADEPGGRSQNGYDAAAASARRQRPVPLLRDSRGVEYYAYAEQVAQQSGASYGPGMPHEPFPQHALAMHRLARDNVSSTMAPHATPGPYVHAVYHKSETPRLRLADHAAPDMLDRYTAVPYQLGSGHGTYSQATADAPYLDAHTREAAYRGGIYQPTMVTPAVYELPRAHSVHPQPFVAMQHHSSATPLHAPVPMHARATSVYPSSNHQPPMSSYQNRLW